jgi:hypothetical protein
MGIEGFINGQWVLIADDVYEGRSYPLFALLAGVRNDPEWGITPISEPRGVPDDASRQYELEAQYQAECGYHSFSWLTAEDIRAVDLNATYTRDGTVRTLGSLLATIPVLDRLYDHTRQYRLVFYFSS